MQLTRRKTAAALAAVIAITAAILGGMAPATTSADAAIARAHDSSTTAHAKKRATVTLQDLKCLTTEDWTGGDELYIRAGGVKIWTAQDSVNDGESIPVNRKVKVGATVALYDADSPDSDDFLGSDVVEGGRGTLVFGHDDAGYTLDYD